MISISSEILQTWVVSLLWPLTRILGVISVAPVLNHNSIPKRVKLGLGILITLIVIPTLPPVPQFDVFSFQGLFILIQQLVIGAAIGFAMRIVFAAVEMAGQMIGMTMGLGFATFFDPQSHGQSTALNQFFVLLAMLVFLSLNGHLILISTMAESFAVLPISAEPININYMKIALWGEKIFSAGLLLALPAVTALLLANMALGILTRTAPQLNLFGIGFPITISVGVLVIALMLPGMSLPLQKLVNDGLAMARQAVSLDPQPSP